MPSGQWPDQQFQSEYNDRNGNRYMKIEGSERQVAFARHLLSLRIALHEESLADLSDSEEEEVVEQNPDVKSAATVLAKYGNI